MICQYVNEEQHAKMEQTVRWRVYASMDMLGRKAFSGDLNIVQFFKGGIAAGLKDYQMKKNNKKMKTFKSH